MSPLYLDGNGRWAKKKNMPRNYGHAQGSKNVERICEECLASMGIKYLTVYAFSTENWNRPVGRGRCVDEASAKLYEDLSEDRGEEPICGFGSSETRPALDEDIRTRIDWSLRRLRRKMVGLNFQIAINYGSRDEMVRAIRRMAADVRDGTAGIRRRLTRQLFEHVSGYSWDSGSGSFDPDKRRASGCPIIFSGSWRIRNFILRTFCGRILQKRNWKRLLSSIIAETARYGGVKEERGCLRQGF